MKVYLTVNDVERLSRGCIFRVGDEIFKPSYKVMDICKSMLSYKSLLNTYTPVLESNVQVTSIYLQKVRRRRKVVKK